MQTPQLVNKELTVIEAKQETLTTKTVTLAIGGIHFQYVPGQYIKMQLNNVDNALPFSLASSPTDSGKLIIATYTSGSEFKRAFQLLKPGDKVKVSGPYGTFILHEDYTRPALFICGGIGITPFRSMLKYATDKRLPLKITLLYSNNIPEEILFKAELDEMQRQNKNIKIVYTITRPEESDVIWQGRTGRIDAELMSKHIAEGTQPGCYLCGPPGMVDELQRVLGKLNVPRERIRVERFIGYK